ncbi:hypothetical protein OHA21_19150 [Actinoplanes sp. NBC_00393]|uniref:hypothetical protein n=1 Tax=Actinoplanes sp. NBC_00393 TaxID=2975953 RepID=UPI002E1B0DD1
MTLVVLRDRFTEPPERPDGRIVVLDRAETLLKHNDVYQDLMGHPTVTGLICVAVGDAGPEAQVDGVVLAAPTSLRPDGERRSAILWAGDPVGLDWAPHSAPSFPQPGGTPFDDLLAALQIPEIFDRVLAAVADLPQAVGSPAARLAFGPPGDAALSDAATAAVRSLVDPGDLASRGLAQAARRLDDDYDPAGAVLEPPISDRARDARRKLARVVAAADTVGACWRLFGADRPTATAGAAMLAATRAAEAYRADVDRLLGDMDRHLEEQRPPLAEVVDLGVAEPRPPRIPRIVAGLRELVGERLADGVTLPDLVHELQAASAFSAPQGVGGLHERMGRVPIPDGTLPAFPRWPLSLWSLPLILLSCLACVLVAGPGPDGPVMGLLLALTWAGTGWLLLARRPGSSGEQGFGPSLPAALLTYGVAGALGVAGGYLLRQLLTEAPVLPYAMVVFGVLILVAVATGWRGWQTAARRWRREMPLAELSATVATLDEGTAQACVTEWQPMRRRRAVSAVADAAAGGVEAIRRSLDEAGETVLPAPRHRAADGAERIPEVALPELFQVIRGDLADLCRTALGPVWAAAGAPHGSADAEVVREFHGLLSRYREHVGRNGLMSPFGPISGTGTRNALMVRAWDATPAARQALAGRTGDRMTQLCATDQLGFLSTRNEPTLIRFAPRRLAEVLQRDPGDQRIAEDPQILWTEGGEFVGAIRLVPLRPESVRYGWADGGAQ